MSGKAQKRDDDNFSVPGEKSKKKSSGTSTGGSGYSSEVDLIGVLISRVHSAGRPSTFKDMMSFNFEDSIFAYDKLSELYPETSFVSRNSSRKYFFHRDFMGYCDGRDVITFVDSDTNSEKIDEVVRRLTEYKE
jgi:hypothetical protein